MEDYASEKLKFVSNLKGTTLNEIFTLLTLFPLINFLAVLAKTALLFYASSNYIEKLNSQKRTGSLTYFCKSFMLDFLFCLVPLVLVCTVLSGWKLFTQLALMVLILWSHKFANAYIEEFKFPLAHFMPTSLGLGKSEDALLSFDSVEEEVVRLSIKSCRVWLYMLTAVGILGVDFKIFPRENAKTENFGVSAMDLGVGLYIVCHSMKIIRNSQIEQDDSMLANLKKFPRRFWSTLKSCSFLIVIGLARLVSVKATSYVEHVSEYGVHWNFLFTIVLVKLLVCPLQVVIGNSSVRSLLIGSTIAFYYQIFLTNKNYTGYLLYDKNRRGFINANKEGIYSCVGYVSIYLISQAVFLRLSSILYNNQKKTNKVSFMSIIQCIVNLVAFVIFSLFLLNWCTMNVQNVSRRLCNMSFICFTLFSSTTLLTLYMVTVLLIAKFCVGMNKTILEDGSFTNSSIKEILLKLRLIFSFAVVIDSKYVGLVTFLVSNLLTGAVNLSINTLKINSMAALSILFVYSFASFALPNLFYYFVNFKYFSNEKKSQ